MNTVHTLDTQALEQVTGGLVGLVNLGALIHSGWIATDPTPLPWHDLIGAGGLTQPGVGGNGG